MDPATFATELEILAVRGFGDMGKCAWDWMIRDRFIAAQRSCGLRRHLDCVPPDTPSQDNRQLPVRAKSVPGSRSPIVPDSPIGMGRGLIVGGPPVSGARKHGRGMRPAGGDRRSAQKVKDGHTDVREKIIVISDEPVVRENTGVVPLSVEAEEFSLRTVPKNRVPTGEGSDGSGNCVPSWEVHGGVVGQYDAAVSTTAVAGAASMADFAGAVAPADLARTDVPAVAGMKFSAVAEVYSSPIDDEGAPLVIRASKQRRAVVGAGPVWPGGECGGLVDGMT